MNNGDWPRRLAAEAIGTAFLLAGVVGSGIMGEMLSGGSVGLALLANTLATGAILAVLIQVFGPLSGAHFNPAVTLAMVVRRELLPGLAVAYVAAQCLGGLVGTLAAHAMFDLPIWQDGIKVRTGGAQWFSEGVATFGLLMTIFGVRHARPDAVAYAVGLYITSAYWYTASTSFANPAVTLARSFTDSFAGIRLDDAPPFIAAQLAGALLALACAKGLGIAAPRET